MPDTKISALPVTVNPALSDLIPVVNTGQTRRITQQDVLDLHSPVSRKIGNLVVLNPNNLGSYVDAQAAISDVPQGGTLLIVEDYDVTVHGPIKPGKPIAIEGAGWSYQITSNVGVDAGVRITNTGTPVDDYCIDFDAGSTTGARIDGARIKNLHITQHAANKYAVRHAGSIKTRTENIKIDCGDLSPGGIWYTTSAIVNTGSFFAVGRDVYVTGFTEAGIKIQGKGSQYNFYDFHIRSTYNPGVGSIQGILCELKDSHFIRGEISVTYGPGIRFYANNTTGEGHIYGCTVHDVLAEKGPGFGIVEFDGDGTFKCQECHVYHPIMTLDGMYYVRFISAISCHLHYPVPYGFIFSNGDTDPVTQVDPFLVHFGVDSHDCTVNVSSRNGALLATDDGGNRPLIKVDGGTMKEFADHSAYWAPSIKARADYLEVYEKPLIRRNGVWEPISSNANDALTTPADIASCVSWVDADDFASAGAVSSWVNKIAGAASFDQANGSKQPQAVMDVLGRGIKGVQFDGVDDYLESTAAIALGANKGTILVIATPSGMLDDATQYYVTARASQVDGVYMRVAGGTGDEVRAACILQTVLVNNTPSSTDNIIDGEGVFVAARYDGANVKNKVCMENSEVTVANNLNFTQNGAVWQVGANGSASPSAKFFKGFIHAVCYFNDSLTNAELQEVSFYLMNKYRTKSILN